MNLAVILSISFSLLSVTAASALPAREFSAWPATRASNGQQTQSADSSSQTPASAPPQSAEPSQPPAAPAQSPSSATQTTSPSKPTAHRKKKTPCSNGPAQPPVGKSANSTATSSAKPCPPPKKVVHNGGSDEPSIQLVGGNTADQASQQRSTEQLTSATEDNLKRLGERQLSSSKQGIVDQIKQFLDQSKAALAAGDSARGRNLAQKAYLLSEDLVKPAQ